MQKGLSEHLTSLTLAGRGIHTLGPAAVAGVLNLQELEAYIFFQKASREASVDKARCGESARSLVISLIITGKGLLCS